MNLLTRCAAAGLILLTALILLEAVHLGASGSSDNTFDVKPEMEGYRSNQEIAGQPSAVTAPDRRLLPASLPSQHIVIDIDPSDRLNGSLAGDQNQNILSTSSGNAIDTTSSTTAETSSLLTSSPNGQSSETDDQYTVADPLKAEIGPSQFQPPINSRNPKQSIDVGSDSPLILSSPDSSSTTSSVVMSEVGAPFATNAAQDDTEETDDPVDSLPSDEETIAEKPVEKPPLPIASLSPQMIALRNQIRTTLGQFQRPLLSTDTATVSDIIIGNLPYGCKTEVIRVDAGRQTRINGITILCWNYECGGYQPLTISDGHISAKIGYGLQNMPGEMLGVFAFARVPADYPMRVGEDVRNVEDLVESEKLLCRSGTNQSMRLIGLVRYLPEDNETWENLYGEQWSIERLVSEELDMPVTTAGEEGPLRLLALAYTLAMRENREQPLTGEFERAAEYLNKFHDFALNIQNRDGSWSAAFLGGRGECRYDKTKLRTTGSIFEWLSVSLPDADLYKPQVMQSAALLTNLLSASEYRGSLTQLSSSDIAAVMHALHALAIYDNRAFVPFDPVDEEE